MPAPLAVCLCVGAHLRRKSRGPGRASRSTEVGRQAASRVEEAPDAPGEAEARPACVIVAGIPGSGKSTLCRILCGIFENAAWINQDQFVSGSSPGSRKRARELFLSGIRRALTRALEQSGQGSGSHLVCVDKVNVLQEHRQDVLTIAEELGWQAKGGLILLCELTATAPSSGKSLRPAVDKDRLLSHCLTRVQERGAAHKSLRPEESDIQEVLEKFVHISQRVSLLELASFDEQVVIDISRSAVEKASEVIAALQGLGWSPELRPAASRSSTAEEWVLFPATPKRPAFFWNRRSRTSAWELPGSFHPAWHGFATAEGDVFFRCARTLETMWELPPMPHSGLRDAPSEGVAEDDFAVHLEAEFQRLQQQEELLRQRARHRCRAAEAQSLSHEAKPSLANA